MLLKNKSMSEDNNQNYCYFQAILMAKKLF